MLSADLRRAGDRRAWHTGRTGGTRHEDHRHPGPDEVPCDRRAGDIRGRDRRRLRAAARPGRWRGRGPRAGDEPDDQGPARRIAGHLQERPLRGDGREGGVRRQREDRQGQAEARHGDRGRGDGRRHHDRERRSVRVFGRLAVARLPVASARAAEASRGCGEGRGGLARRGRHASREAWCAAEAAGPRKRGRAGDPLRRVVRVLALVRLPGVHRVGRRGEGQWRLPEAAGRRGVRAGRGGRRRQGAVRIAGVDQRRRRAGVPLRPREARRRGRALDMGRGHAATEAGRIVGAGPEGVVAPAEERRRVEP